MSALIRQSHADNDTPLWLSVNGGNVGDLNVRDTLTIENASGTACASLYGSALGNVGMYVAPGKSLFFGNLPAPSAAYTLYQPGATSNSDLLKVGGSVWITGTTQPGATGAAIRYDASGGHYVTYGAQTTGGGLNAGNLQTFCYPNGGPIVKAIDVNLSGLVSFPQNITTPFVNNIGTFYGIISTQLFSPLTGSPINVQSFPTAANYIAEGQVSAIVSWVGPVVSTDRIEIGFNGGSATDVDNLFVTILPETFANAGLTQATIPLAGLFQTSALATNIDLQIIPTLAVPGNYAVKILNGYVRNLRPQ